MKDAETASYLYGQRQQMRDRLRQHHAMRFPDADETFSSAFRDDVLLLPTGALAEDPGLIGRINDDLQGAGLGELGHPRPAGPASEALASPAPLTPVSLTGTDAWTAYRQITSRSAPGGAAGVRLERIMDAGAITVPVWLEAPVPGDPLLLAAGEKQGHGDPGRMPVAVIAPPPPWPRLTNGPGGRAPVVALLDTTVDTTHDWFAGPHAPESFFVGVSPTDWRPSADLPRVASHSGHGTFISGLIRQQAPGVRVMPLLVMSDGGFVGASGLLAALTWLAGELERAGEHRPFDVVCMAFGYEEEDGDRAHTEDLRALLRRIVSHGVTIVASAGNHGSDRRTYPAAFAVEEPFTRRQVVSVGARNPGGKDAYYTNHGDWVVAKEIGTGLVSTMRAFNGPGTPRDPGRDDELPDSIGELMDPDNFSSRFGRWSGTSFAAAVVAAKLAAGMQVDWVDAGTHEIAAVAGP